MTQKLAMYIRIAATILMTHLLMKKTRSSSKGSNTPQSGQEYLEMLAELFRRNGWQVKTNPWSVPRMADPLLFRGDYQYVAELKVSSEGRRNRLVPGSIQYVLMQLHR